MLVLYLLILLIGVIGGATGVGGMLIPPCLEFFAGIDTHTAIGTGMACMIPASLFGTWMNRRGGYLDLGTIWPLIIGGALFVLPGTILKAHTAGPTLTFLLGICIVGTSLVSLFTPLLRSKGQPTTKRRKILLFLLGSLVGLLAGVTGMGGSILTVPAMIAMGFTPVFSVAAGIAYVIPVTCLGSVGNFAFRALDIYLAVTTSVFLTVGMGLGVKLARKVRQDCLRQGVVAICTTCGLYMIWKSLLSV